MDWNTVKEKVSRLIGRYKYVLIVILAGIFLMCIPSGDEKVQETPSQELPPPIDLTEKLENILAAIEGVGRVHVLITEANSARTVYQTDEQRSSDGSVRVETVIVSGGSREEKGMIISVTPPCYLGAIVVCQGADRPAVKLSVIQAVSNVTGISSDRISVVKMK